MNDRKSLFGRVEKIIFGGYGLIRSTESHPTLFIPYTSAGEYLEDIEPKIEKKNHILCEKKDKKDVLAKTAHLCSHYTQCQGCQLMHLSYPEQLESKKSMIQDVFCKNSFSLQKEEIQIYPSPKITNYRRKIKLYSFWDENTQKWSVRYFEKMPINSCILFDDSIIKIFNEHFFAFIPKEKWSIYICIEMLKNNSFLVKITHPQLDKKFILSLPIFDTLPKYIDTFMINEECLWGKDSFQITYNHGTFEYNSRCFMQNNLELIQVLYTHLHEQLKLFPIETILDLYCGMGVTSSLFASLGKKVIGVEENPHSIELALKRKEENIEYFVSKIEDFHFFHHTKKFDCVFMNPPRVGLHKKALEKIVSLKAPYLIYSSCMISTLERDLLLLKKENYEIIFHAFYDFFPHTTHFESLIILKDKNK